MDPEDPEGGEDWSQWDAGPQGDGLSDRLCGPSHALGQIPTERRYVT